MTTLPLCTLVVLSASCVGCLQKSSTEERAVTRPRIAATESALALVCWFLEDNGAGQHGYAAADGRLGFPRPDAGGLFGSIDELREAMKRQRIKTANIETSFGG